MTPPQPSQPNQAVESAVRRISVAALKALSADDHYAASAMLEFEDTVRAELARPLEVTAPVGVVSVSPLHVGVGWVGGYVPKNGEKLYLAAARVPVASPAEPLGFTTGVFWHEDPRAQSEQVVKITRKAQPHYGFTFPIYATPPVGAGGSGVMDARPDSFHSDSGECDRVQGPGPTDAERFAWWFSEDEIKHEFLPTYLEGVTGKWTLDNWRAAIDAAILAKGGDQGEGK